MAESSQRINGKLIGNVRQMFGQVAENSVLPKEDESLIHPQDESGSITHFSLIPKAILLKLF